MSDKTIYRPIAVAGVALFLMVVPHFLSLFYKELLIEILIFGLFSLGFDILSGMLALVADALGVTLLATPGDGGGFIFQHKRLYQIHITNAFRMKFLS